MKLFSLAALLLPFATATGSLCGTGVSPLNSNDFSSTTAMERDGWIFAGITSFKKAGYHEDQLAPGYSSANAWWGWGGGPNVGNVETQMQVTGEVTLKYGCIHPTGYVTLKKNGIIIDVASVMSQIRTMTFSVNYGDVILLSEYDTSVIAIYSINVCGDPPTVAPTVTPTTTPTGTPTTTPTGTPTTAEAFKQEQVDNDFAMSPWRTGRGTGDDIDTVYMCSDYCFKNEAGARDGFAYVGAEADQTVTLGNNAEFITSDGRFDLTPLGGITFTESATGTQMLFPWDCTCGN